MFMNTEKYKIIKTVVTMLQESQYSPHFDIMPPIVVEYVHFNLLQLDSHS